MRTKQITAATAVSFLKALVYNKTFNLGIKQGLLICNRDTGMPLQVLPAQNALFMSDPKHYFPGNTYDEGKSEREIGKSFDGAYTHANNRLKKIKIQALHHNPHNKQFPIYRGTDNADVDDGSTGELEGVYSRTLILISRFLTLPKTTILQDILRKMDVSASLPDITFPNPEIITRPTHINIASAPLPKGSVNISIGNISKHYFRIGERQKTKPH